MHGYCAAAVVTIMQAAASGAQHGFVMWSMHVAICLSHLLSALLCSVCAADMLGFEAYFVKWCAVIMAGFVLVFMVAIVAALRIFNFQKR
jgi:hypothetical protein